MDELDSDENLALEKLGIKPEKTIGSGSYSRVKSATWKRDDKSEPVRIALKIMNRATAPVEVKKKFFPRELQILKALKHPNIIQMYDSFDIRNKTYICLEFAGHGDLLGFVQVRGPLQDDEMRRIFGGICNAISYLHDKDVIHRDLKCENILMSQYNDVKVADFGFAREIGMNELSTTFCGSAAYAAPEIIKGIDYDGRSADIWSLGVILFIMACSIMPFRDNTKQALLHDQILPLCYPQNVAKNISLLNKDLTSKILNHVTIERYKMNDIRIHPWMNGIAEIKPERKESATPNAKKFFVKSEKKSTSKKESSQLPQKKSIPKDSGGKSRK